MRSESYLRYLLSDNVSLRKYFRERKGVSLKEVSSSLLIKVRSLGYAVPDHYYRLGVEASFLNVNELSELFTVGLPRMADEYLEMHDGRVYVKGERMNDWQLLLPLIPPLLLTTMKIWKKHCPIVDSYVDFAHDNLLPSVRYTALPSAYLPEMAMLREENHGFDDLHIHLNGAVETDLAWHDFLRYPELVYQEILKAYGNDKVKEQIEQLTEVSDPIDFLHLFCIAGRLREWIFGKVVYGTNIYSVSSFENLLTKLTDMSECYKEHPFKQVMGDDTSPLILEGLLYMKALDYMSAHPLDMAVAGAFNYYLLILGLCNKLLVQQMDAFGFEQFQKYTSNNFREFSEKTYCQRFLQLSGNDMKNVKHIEGRFSPKGTLAENVAIITKIMDGFEGLRQCREQAGLMLPTMTLLAHFIKKGDNGKGNVRFTKLRKELVKRTDALIALMNTNGTYAEKVTGADAAASEFDTPPEVFAPSFLRLREHGMRHFTFHAGEDFFHILSGLRAIYEAMEFLGLQAGDKIGHATATGVDVRVWRENIGERIWMRLEDCLDDLVFAYHLIAIEKERGLEHLLPKIALRIEEYAAQIYPYAYNVSE